MKKITLHTDGSSLGNPGFGGYGGILIYIDSKQEIQEKEFSGGMKVATNNQMELLAVIEGLRLLKEPCEIELFTDSNYVVKGINDWIKNWVKNNWRGSDKKTVKNSDLWKDFLELSKEHKINANWVKGHNGDIHNERCDILAKNQAYKLKEE